MEFYNNTRGTILATRVLVADSFVLRLRGLLFRRQLQNGEGLYLIPCQSIHMIGMGYAIDAIFIDVKGVVVGLVEKISPGQISPFFRSAKGCLELPVGTILQSQTKIGDLIKTRDSLTT